MRKFICLVYRRGMTKIIGLYDTLKKAEARVDFYILTHPDEEIEEVYVYSVIENCSEYASKLEIKKTVAI